MHTLRTAQASTAFERHVLHGATMLVSVYGDDLWSNPQAAIKEIETYADAAKDLLAKASKETQDFIKQRFDNDEDLLTKHAARVRTAGGNIAFLKGTVEGLKIDPDNPKFRKLSVEAYGYIRASIEAFNNLII